VNELSGSWLLGNVLSESSLSMNRDEGKRVEVVIIDHICIAVDEHGARRVVGMTVS